MAQLFKMRKCPNCLGRGICTDGSTCPACEGKGEVPHGMELPLEEPCWQPN